MNKTTEQLLSQLNTMQNEHIKVLIQTIYKQYERIDILKHTIEIDKITIKNEHIKVLNERIEVLQHTIQIDKITIQTQEKTIKLYLDNLNSK